MPTVEKKRGRGRPRAFNVDSALDRAVEIFWKKGYEGADLDTLTNAMEINRPSLYAAYGDKRALFFKAVERYYQNFAMLRLPNEADGKRFDPSFFTEAIVHLFYDHERPRGCLIACVLADEANAHEDARAILKELIEREERRIEKWASTFLSGDSAMVNARFCANLLIATLHSVAIKASAGIPRHQIIADLDATMSILMGILKT
ncbi:AcrR family transcriptional regulator [Paraburkholderia sp. UCT70]|uniref:TetR/AcrR family transcriptional regulator n=1 Tax=Paraburkholderia sp. UCT70 TaxID=2991068 RepID=UPI003D21A429